jgi:hypothetical protein
MTKRTATEEELTVSVDKMRTVVMARLDAKKPMTFTEEVEDTLKGLWNRLFTRDD